MGVLIFVIFLVLAYFMLRPEPNPALAKLTVSDAVLYYDGLKADAINRNF